MNLIFRCLSTLTLAATISLFGNLAIPPSARAASEFSQQELSPDQIIAIAQPASGGAFYKLLILRQITNERACWQEIGNQPTRVDPLLLNFDFTGICDRSTDSNGYSLRVGGEDLNWRYRLQIVEQDNDLVLMADPVQDRTMPPLEIGRTRGITDGLLKIELNAGWRMTRRVYDGQPLGHIYLTHNDTLNTLIAAAELTPSRATSRPRPGTNPSPNRGSQPIPSPSESPTSPLPSPTLPNPSPSTPPAQADVYYRVVVPGRNSRLQAEVHKVEPGAFRTTINGRSFIQAGLFQERRRAEELQQELLQARLSAQILEFPGPPPTPIPAPSTPDFPDLPTIPNGGIIVVLDPGHGGRDPGAVGIGGLQEKTINLAVAYKVKEVLERQGIVAPLTRTGDQEVDLGPRVTQAERADADLFVSIHSNAISLSRPDVNGLETYHYGTGAGLARAIHTSVLRQTDVRDRGVKEARFYVLRNTSMPSVLVETGFVTGAEDAARLSNPARRDQLAEAIAVGILDYVQRVGLQR